MKRHQSLVTAAILTFVIPAAAKAQETAASKGSAIAPSPVVDALLNDMGYSLVKFAVALVLLLVSYLVITALLRNGADTDGENGRLRAAIITAGWLIALGIVTGCAMLAAG